MRTIGPSCSAVTTGSWSSNRMNTSNLPGRRQSYIRSRKANVTEPFYDMRGPIHDPKPTIFDVLAHVGQAAKRLRSMFPEGNIFCVEPFPTSFERLSSAFRDEPAVENHQLALAEEPGVPKFTVNKSTAASSLLFSDTRAPHYCGQKLLDPQDEIEVKTETVDRFCARKDIKRLNILKLAWASPR